MERYESQSAVPVADLHGTIEVMRQADARDAERRTGACGLDVIEGATASEGEGLREHSVLTPCHNIIECVDVLRPWPVGRCGVRGLDCEPGISRVHEVWCRGLRFLHAGYALKARFRDTAILKGLIGPLNPAPSGPGRLASASEAAGGPSAWRGRAAADGRQPAAGPGGATGQRAGGGKPVSFASSASPSSISRASASSQLRLGSCCRARATALRRSVGTFAANWARSAAS